MNKAFIYISALLLSQNLSAQNLDKIGEEDMVTVSGGVNTNLVYNEVVGAAQYRDPFAWVLSGNVTVSIVDFTLPFTFSFSNSGSSFTQPFNMTALHPSYKNWKAHIGITSMSLSPYTYQGLNFAGAGVEYTPSKWQFKVFGGRLKKAIEYDPAVDNINSVSYKRFGFGFSGGYKGKVFSSELIAFKAYDDGTSLQFAPVNPELTVQDNAVFSLKSSVKPLKTLSLNAEIASSLLTRDVLQDDPTMDRAFYHNMVRGNQTTEFHQAYNASIDYKIKVFGIGVKYERIDPKYATLGAVYFNNDLENITVNPSFTLFKNKLNFNFSTGYQRNNLDSKEATDSKRWIGSANVSAMITKGLNLNANYSNLSSFTRRNPSADPFYNPIGDTLNYYQVSQNLSTSINYSFGDSIKQSVALTGSYSQSENITGRLDDAGAFGFNVTADTNSTPVDVYTGVLMHRLNFSKSGLSLGWSANANHSVVMDNATTFFGPGINASKAIKKAKLNLTTGVTYNRQYLNATLQNHVMNYRLGATYNPEWWDKKYGSLNMSLNAAFTDRLPVNGGATVKNLTVITNLAYQF